MKKSNSLLASIMLITLMTTYNTNAQSTKANGANANNRQFNTEYLGWQATSTLPGPLQIRNDIPLQPINFFTSNIEQMRIDPSGFVGLNNTTPNFHLDMVTPERQGGELLFRARVGGDNLASMNIINLAGTNNTVFVPAIFGLQSAVTAGSAFNTVGSMENTKSIVIYQKSKKYLG